ncbi:unnamed protein product [Spirodela intermedia]|uniref:Gnk2-homologous domain-containing protein n=1 Tax=Spirodela intermedia TaxID=51605 RepID=A0A7I8LGU6_SPIIN|nr:unnamed protein product [Spirodela intermedia]
MGAPPSSSPFLPSSFVGLLAVSLLVLTPLARPASDESFYKLCSNSRGNYTANSTYQVNLGALLSSLATGGTENGGFISSSVGETPLDTVYGLVLCRGDVGTNSCRHCLDTATDDVRALCPYRKEAVIWYDSCLLRYSDRWSFPQVSSMIDAAMWNVQNISAEELPLFNEQLGKMMTGLASFAAYNSSGRLFATGEAEFAEDIPKIYGLVQCTRDQAVESCQRCLAENVRWIREFFYGKRGARTLGSYCFLRYEVYPFYNDSAMLRIPLPKAESPSPTASRPVVIPSPSPSYPTSKGAAEFSLIIPVEDSMGLL